MTESLDVRQIGLRGMIQIFKTVKEKETCDV